MLFLNVFFSWVWWWLIPRRRGFWEGWWSVLACSLLAVQSDCWCADPTALWTGEGLGWDWLGCCSLFLPPVSLLCGFMPLCLKLTTGFSHRWAPTVWGLLLPRHGWLPPVQAAPSAGLCNAFLDYLSWITMIVFSFLELAEENRFGHAYIFHPFDVASPAQLHLKHDGLYAGQAGSLEDFFLWHSLAFWCQEWSASSIGKTALGAWSPSDREPRSLHHRGGWEWRWL